MTALTFSTSVAEGASKWVGLGCTVELEREDLAWSSNPRRRDMAHPLVDDSRRFR
jgi:hypothetical protein